MLRCAASFVIAAYEKVRLIPQDLRALPAALFTKPSFAEAVEAKYVSVNHYASMKPVFIVLKELSW